MILSTRRIKLGITDDEIALGTHLIHFWDTEEEFERGVRFVELGLLDDSQHCVLFGHEEANLHVLEILQKNGQDVDRAIQGGRFVIRRRESSAAETLANIEAAFSSAMSKGSTAIRYLGNLGMGKVPLPGKGADEVIELETGATELAARFPCVIVCMYDVNTVSGRLVLRAGFGTHPLAVGGAALQENQYCGFIAQPATGT